MLQYKKDILQFPQNVSRETLEKLEFYVVHLLKWNKKINLISRTTEEEIWGRHIIDCLQIIKFLEKDQVIIDVGSGAGLPGIIIALSLECKMHLVESDSRKCAFLNEIASQLKCNITIYNNRIEKIPVFASDAIISRAFANLEDIFILCKEFIEQTKYCLFLKGEKVLNEITLARQKNKFTYELINSITNTEGKILKLIPNK